MKERIIKSIIEVKGCTYEEAVAMLLAAAKEWEKKISQMRRRTA